MNQSEIQQKLQKLGDHLEELRIIFQNNEDKTSLRVQADKWSPKEILGHLYDVELVFTYRLKMMAEKDQFTMIDYSQDHWVREHEYNQWDTFLLIDGLIALRKNTIFWLGRIKDEIWGREGHHPRRGTVTFEFMVNLLLSHFEHHLNQIKTMVNA